MKLRIEKFEQNEAKLIKAKIMMQEGENSRKNTEVML